MDGGVVEKQCRGCGEIKPIAEFFPSPKYTGGHVHYCNLCRSAKHRKWYLANRDKKLAQNRTWAEANKEHVKEMSKVYRQEHREEGNERMRAWRSIPENRERTKKRDREIYSQKPAGYAAEKSRKFYANNPISASDNDRRKHARRRGREGSHTAEEFIWLNNLLGNVCLWCGKSGLDVEITHDHIDPDGSDYIENIQPLCRICNTRKSDRFTCDFRPLWLSNNFSKLKAEAGFDPNPNITVAP